MRKPIASMPGQAQVSVDEAVAEAEECRALGIPAVILFGVPRQEGRGRLRGVERRRPGAAGDAARSRSACPELTVILDACFDEYTTHGHCGVVVDGDVDNDATLENLGRVARQPGARRRRRDRAVGHDGRLRRLGARGARRGGLRARCRSWPTRPSTPRASTARSARRPAPRRSSATARATRWIRPTAHEAIREVTLDVGEGADIIMVKPALAYLDVIARVRDEIDLPVAAYNVSGEYAMLKAAAERGWIDHDRAVLETLTSIKRAGADMILTYHAKEAARAASGRAEMLQYKIVETSTVTDEELERIVNEWVETGWVFEGFQFAMRESSKRPSMAFVIFTRELEEEGPN